MPSPSRRTEVLRPNLGIYLDRAALNIPLRGLKDALNVRIRNGAIVRDSMGWAPFPLDGDPLNLSGDPVTGFDLFQPRSGGQTLLILTTKDVYRFIEASGVVELLTPRYEVGTVDVVDGSAVVTGNGTTWTTNVKVGDRIHVGATDQQDPDAIWYDVESVDSDTQLTLTENYAEATANGEDYTARLTFTGTVLTPWWTESFLNAEAVTVGSDGDRWYATNGLDPVIAWGIGLTQVYEPAINLTQVKWIRRVSNLMIYGGITVSGEPRLTSIRTSDIGKPEDTAGGFASELLVHESEDPLHSAYRIGDVVVIYGARTITMMQFVGGDVLFVFRRVASVIGAVSSRAVAEFGNYHEIIGPDAQYRFDGASLTPINNHVWPALLRQLSPSRLDLVNAHFDEANGEVLWTLPFTTDADPEGGPPERAVVEHYLEIVAEGEPTPFTLRDLPATALGLFERETVLAWEEIQETWEELNFRWNDSFLQAVFPFVLFGSNTGEAFVLGAKDSQNGVGILSFARFGRRQLGDTRTKGTLRRVYPFVVNGTGDLLVNLHTTRDPSGSTTLVASLPYGLSLEAPNHFVSPRLTGRYVEVEFRREGENAPFTLEGYDVDVVRAGER